MGEGSGRGSGRVGSHFLSAIAGRVGSGVNISPGRVGSEKSDPWTTLCRAAGVSVFDVLTHVILVSYTVSVLC